MKKYHQTALNIAVLWMFLFHQIVWADSSKRIVSLDLCTDWMLLKYASRSQTITYSPLLYRYQPDWVPDGLPVHDGSLEQVLEIKPDLIISGEFNATLITKRLKQLGETVEIMPLPLNLSSIIDYSNRFKSLLQIDVLLQTSVTGQQFEPNGKSLLLLGANGIGTGKGTLENDIIEKSGWNNYIQSAGFVSLDLEKIVYDPPDAVLWSKPVSNSLANLFAKHTVLTTIINLPNNENGRWRWQCPGPWTFDLITQLALKK